MAVSTYSTHGCEYSKCLWLLQLFRLGKCFGVVRVFRAPSTETWANSELKYAPNAVLSTPLGVL